MGNKPTRKELFHTATARRNVEPVRAAIAAGMPLNKACLYTAYTPLHYLAGRAPQAALVKTLIEAGSDVNVRMPRGPDAGHTALTLAALVGQTAIVRRL